MARRTHERREPRLDDDRTPARDDIRVRPEDRPTARASTTQRRARAPEWDTPDGGPPDRAAKPGGRGGGRGARKRKPQRKRGLFGALLYWTAIVGIWAVLAVGAVIAWYAAHLPPMSELEVPERPPNIAIVGTTGEVMINRGAMGQAIRLRDLPRHLPNAVLSIEDRRFYSHFGVDPIGIGRALFRNVVGGGVSEGGSTITQQLAKNLFLTHDRTMGRKVQELILALWLEAEYSKDEILEMYLNRVYLGAGAYGVEGAAQRYFGKSAREVTLQEAAVLAGLLQAPSRFAPTRNPQLAMQRARVVLGAMVAAGHASEADARAAGQAALRVRPADPTGNSIQYAADWVMDMLPSLVGTISQDVVVETTIDPGLQRAAERALREVLDRDGQRFQASQGAVVTIDVNGAVRALVGGRSYQDSQFNRAVTARRQPGSAFKPFVYLAALERGMTPETRRDDSPVNIRGWSPENFTRDYRGSVTLRDALALSLNTVPARLAVEMGPQSITRMAERLGVQSPLQATPSIALGTSEVSLLELTRAYAPLANGGAGVIPHVIRSIRTANGRVLFQRSGDGPGRIIRADHVAAMNGMLAQAVSVGTARNARVPGWSVAGKTGTSQEFRDAWFVGYTAQMVTGVWLGNDDGSSMRRASGGGLPTQVWNRVMAVAHEGMPPLQLPGAGRPLAPPDGQPPRTIDDILLGGGGTSVPTPAPPRQTATRGAPPQPTQQEGCPIDAGFLACLFRGQ